MRRDVVRSSFLPSLWVSIGSRRNQLSMVRKMKNRSPARSSSGCFSGHMRVQGPKASLFVRLLTSIQWSRYSDDGVAAVYA